MVKQMVKQSNCFFCPIGLSMSIHVVKVLQHAKAIEISQQYQAVLEVRHSQMLPSMSHTACLANGTASIIPEDVVIL